MITNYKEIATNAIRNLGLALEQERDDAWRKNERELEIKAWEEIEEQSKILEMLEYR